MIFDQIDGQYTKNHGDVQIWTGLCEIKRIFDNTEYFQ